jgi:hypothetical protein
VFKSGVGWSLRKVQTKLLGAVYWALNGIVPGHPPDGTEPQ